LFISPPARALGITRAAAYLERQEGKARRISHRATACLRENERHGTTRWARIAMFWPLAPEKIGQADRPGRKPDNPSEVHP
jgi:hypothetical protein